MNATVQRVGTAQSSPQPVQRFEKIRSFTESLTVGLSAEDCQIQSMEAASPIKWHLAHTTWFFETFVLSTYVREYKPFRPEFRDLFNSYYNHVGVPYTRSFRGLLTRPSLQEVLQWRAYVNAHVLELLEQEPGEVAASLVELGLQHEQQHQELMLTDLLHAFSHNPVAPTYRPLRVHATSGHPAPLKWQSYTGGTTTTGAAESGFAFDNERPRHRRLLIPFELASRPATNGEYRAFMEDGGYETSTLWLSDGWATVKEQGWQRPLYWSADNHSAFTLHGTQDLADNAPVCHLSYYEADAFARWAGARLPTEAEWEHAAGNADVAGHFVDSGTLIPTPASVDADGLAQIYGDVWEWTQSAYSAYPGYRTPVGAVGEYNGKFMCNQFVLRGGSCASSRDHLRPSYRNFFPPAARWQFTGLRLARDAV